MTKATVYPLYIENYSNSSNTQIEVFTFTVTLTDENDQTLPNLAGAFSIFTVKDSYVSSNSLVSVSTTSNNITINGVSGEVTLKLYQPNLVNIPRNREESEYLYDWDLVDTTGKFYRLLKGTVTFAGDL